MALGAEPKPDLSRPEGEARTSEDSVYPSVMKPACSGGHLHGKASQRQKMVTTALYVPRCLTPVRR